MMSFAQREQWVSLQMLQPSLVAVGAGFAELGDSAVAHT